MSVFFLNFVFILFLFHFSVALLRFQYNIHVIFLWQIKMYINSTQDRGFSKKSESLTIQLPLRYSIYDAIRQTLIHIQQNNCCKKENDSAANNGKSIIYFYTVKTCYKNFQSFNTWNNYHICLKLFIKLWMNLPVIERPIMTIKVIPYKSFVSYLCKWYINPDNVCVHDNILLFEAHSVYMKLDLGLSVSLSWIWVATHEAGHVERDDVASSIAKRTSSRVHLWPPSFSLSLTQHWPAHGVNAIQNLQRNSFYSFYFIMLFK